MKTSSKTSVFSFILVFFLTSSSVAQVWNRAILIDEIVGKGSSIGAYSSLRNVNGKPAMVYWDDTHQNLMFIRALDAAGEAWGAPRILEYAGDVGNTLSFEIVNNKPAVSYSDFTDKHFKFIIAKDEDGTDWYAPVQVEGRENVGLYSSLTVVNGKPAVSYYDYNENILKYCRAYDADGQSWQLTSFVDYSGNVGLFTSIQVVNNHPAIAYFDYTNNNLKYVRAEDPDGLVWGEPITIDSIGTVGYYPSLRVVDGYPAIAYWDGTNTALKFVTASDPSGANWLTPKTLDDQDAIGEGPSLQIVDGVPAISYYDKTNGNLNFIRAQDAAGSSWNTPVVLDAAEDVGLRTNLTIINGNPAISYFDNTNADLKYIRATNVSGTSWNTPLSFDENGATGFYLSMAMVNGYPAVAFGATGNLRYVQATDSTGAAWGKPVVLDEPGYVGDFASLSVVSGKPAVSYFDATNGKPKYVRALDADGTQWPTPVTVIPTLFNGPGPQGHFTSLEDVHGNPGIVYTNSNSQVMIYVRATDPDGTSWPTLAFFTDEVLGLGSTKSLRMINNKPAIAYGNETSHLNYVRAQDDIGGLWEESVTVDNTVSVGDFPSLQQVEGKPAIVYYDRTKKDLKYVRAMDVNGTTWGTPVVVDSVGITGRSTSLQIIDGFPAISYYDLTRKALRYVRALDSAGTSWGEPVTLWGMIKSDLNPSADMGIRTSMIPLRNGGVGIAYTSEIENFPYFIASRRCNGSTKPILSPDVTICQGDSTDLRVIGGFANDAGRWQWHTGSCDGTITAYDEMYRASPATSTTYFVNAGGSYVCTQQPGECGIIHVNVVTQPLKPVITFQQDSPMELTLIASGGTDYQWYLDGEPIDGANESTLVILSAGSYTVQSGSSGCPSEMSDAKVVTVMGVEMDEDALRVYPNPSNRKFIIALPSSFEGQVKNVMVKDMLGKSLKPSIQIGRREVEVDLGEQQAGVYLITLKGAAHDATLRLMKKD